MQNRRNLGRLRLRRIRPMLQLREKFRLQCHLLRLRIPGKNGSLSIIGIFKSQPFRPWERAGRFCFDDACDPFPGLKWTRPSACQIGRICIYGISQSSLPHLVRLCRRMTATGGRIHYRLCIALTTNQTPYCTRHCSLVCTTMKYLRLQGNIATVTPPSRHH